jgi:hypothetical protein
MFTRYNTIHTIETSTMYVEMRFVRMETRTLWDFTVLHTKLVGGMNYAETREGDEVT